MLTKDKKNNNAQRERAAALLLRCGSMDQINASNKANEERARVTVAVEKEKRRKEKQQRSSCFKLAFVQLSGEQTRQMTECVQALNGCPKRQRQSTSAAQDSSTSLGTQITNNTNDEFFFFSFCY